MLRRRSFSAKTMRVFEAMAQEPESWRYGYDLCTELGLKSGSLYPILIRLADRGFLDSSWESGHSGRPPRHLYRLTDEGVAQAAALGRRTLPARARREL